MTTLAAGGLPEHEMLIAKQLASKVPQRQAAALTTLRKTLDGAALARHAGAGWLRAASALHGGGGVPSG